jgi:23S rRNA (uracil1939-C5)-methyltransferase
LKAGAPPRLADVESLDHEGRGVAHVDGKAIFIDGALPGERVEFVSYRRKPSFELADATRILTASSSRVEPRCVHFGHCGGCSMQHLDARAQVSAKQRVLEDNLARIGRVSPEQMLAPIRGPSWGYRYRARMSARYVVKKQAMLVGFHERRSSFVADMKRCEVLPRRISDLLVPLRALVDALSIRDRMPQIELAIGDAVDVLVLRILAPLTAADESLVRRFADEHRVRIFLQTKGPETALPFHPVEAPELRYVIPDYALAFPFKPTDFTQVNHEINRVLVRRAVTLLEPQPGERIGDFFCGLGNFSLAIARSGASVFGVEGSATLVQRARRNAEFNGLAGRSEFAERNLFEVTPDDWKQFGRFDRVLIDPPRDGAIELAKAICEAPPARIVYVSCNPATLARDASVLVHTGGYRLSAAGIVNMFPHTSHVESIAVFDR